ncbi:hypothetical protein TNCV_1182971 [Trichonephila clavipes]|nr:hypothetical protein TNCV_1182971 [Trichonephila clavipes]
MLSESCLDNDERVSIPNFDCCVHFKRPSRRAVGVAIYRKQKNSHAVTPHMNITFRQTSGLGIVAPREFLTFPYLPSDSFFKKKPNSTRKPKQEKTTKLNSGKKNNSTQHSLLRLHTLAGEKQLNSEEGGKTTQQQEGNNSTLLRL